MTCQEFRSRHSEYLDGWLNADEEARFRAHIEACAGCARHDRVVRRSLELVATIPSVEPASDFHERLQHRILHLQDEMTRHDRFAGSGTLASLAIAAIIAIVAWGPLVWPAGVRDVDGPAVAAGEQSAPAAGTATDLGTIEWFGGAPGSPGAGGPHSMSAAFPGPYSPLIVEAPVTRTSRRAASAVFAAYYTGVE